MQWQGPGSGAREQIIGQKWLTRWGDYGFIGAASMTAYRGLGYPFKNLRGLTFSYAMRDVDIQTEFGQDIVLTGLSSGFDEDLLAPVGVMDENLILPDEPPVKKLVNVVMFGYVPRMYCVAAPAVDQTLLTLGSLNGGGTCLNYGLSEFISFRRLTGVATSTGNAGAIDMAADAAQLDWTNAQGVPYYDVTQATGVGAGGGGGVPTVVQGIVGVRKYGAAYTDAIPNCPSGLSGQPMCQAIVMCLGTTLGRV